MTAEGGAAFGTRLGHEGGATMWLESSFQRPLGPVLGWRVKLPHAMPTSIMGACSTSNQAEPGKAAEGGTHAWTPGPTWEPRKKLLASVRPSYGCYIYLESEPADQRSLSF